MYVLVAAYKLISSLIHAPVFLCELSFLLTQLRTHMYAQSRVLLNQFTLFLMYKCWYICLLLGLRCAKLPIEFLLQFKY